MKKNFMTLIAIVSFSTIAYSQVGIDTEEPKATLDVVASPDDDTKIDGVIAPRLTGQILQSKNDLYGAEQKGTIIYATSASPEAGNTNDKTKNVDAPGYYYFDGSVWVKMTGASDEGIQILLGQNTDNFDFLDHKEIDYFSFKFGTKPLTITMPPASEYKDRIIYIYNQQGTDISVQFDPNETYENRQIMNKIFATRTMTYASDGTRWYSITGFSTFD